MMTTSYPHRNLFPILSWRVLLPIAVLGAVWPHSDRIVVIVAFSLVLIIPLVALALIALIVIGGIGLWNGNIDYQRLSLQGFLVLTIFLVAPVFSSRAVDTYYKWISEKLMEELNGYRREHGTYPTALPSEDGISAIRGLEYVKLNEHDEYMLKYKNCFLVTTIFHSGEREWRSYGWND